MPIERIHPARNPRQSGDREYQTHIEVRWTPDLDMQLGVEFTGPEGASYHLLDALYGGEATQEAIGRAVASVLGADEPSDQRTAQIMGAEVINAITGCTDPMSGLWVETLDRGAANRTIRVIKRARNAAYGADE